MKFPVQAQAIKSTRANKLESRGRASVDAQDVDAAHTLLKHKAIGVKQERARHGC